VGDDDQSIYGWRGAEVDNILRFERDFPGAQVIRLERNYRSTSHILAAASGLIAPTRTGWARRSGPSRTAAKRCACAASGTARPRPARSPTRSAAGTGAGSGDGPRKLREVAILVRASFQMRAFEERFVLEAIPYTVVGGPRFFERQEIRDAHAYLRWSSRRTTTSPSSAWSTRPSAGLGDTSVQKILQLARANGVSASTASRGLVNTDELPARTRTALKTFIRDLDRWRAMGLKGEHHARLTETILEESGYTDMWRADRATGPTRLDNLKELIQAMGAYDTLEAYLEHVSLVMDLDRGAGEDAVQIMTLHAAKGLEFPLVYLPGWEEGVFPSQRSIDEKGEKGLEEERRLAYVGVTRAREEARVSFAANRQVYGRWTSQLPSRFVDELPLAHVEASSETGYYGGGPGMQEARSRWDEAPVFTAGGYTSPGWRRASERANTAAPITPRQRVNSVPIEGEGRLVATSDPDAGASAYKRGDRVFHQKFGMGTVGVVEGNKLTVAFDKAGEKKVIDTFVARG
jgi:DNA helicase-2/ATP-dependent DNA helicase PcrA